MPSIDQLPRTPLAFLPTPLHALPNLSRALGGPNLFIKRDDMTGLAFGGNKARKLEFLVADALAQGANVLVTTGAAQSNHCRQTAAAARKLGMRCVLVLTPSHHEAFNGNILLDALLKAEVVRCSTDERPQVMEQVAAAERARGNKPYLIPVGGSNGLGAMGYCAMLLELQQQCAAQAVTPDAIYFSSGSAGTHAGMQLGRHLAGMRTMLVGISPSGTAAHVARQARAVLADGARILGLQPEQVDDHIDVHDDQVGPGYGICTAASLEAIQLFAAHEGVLLDPVYTAKAAAGLIAHIRAGRLSRGQNVIFLHTGGTPALFAYADELQELSAPVTQSV